MAASTPRRQSPDVRRAQVLDAAETVLLARGVHDATMAEVAEAAGVAKGTVYLYYPAKTELLAALRRRYVEAIAAEVAEAAAKARNPQDKVGALVRALLAASTRRVEVHHLLFQEAGISEADAFAPVHTVFAAVLSEVTGDARQASGLLTDFVLGGVHAAILRLAHATPSQRRRIIADVVELVERLVVPAQAAAPAPGN